MADLISTRWAPEKHKNQSWALAHDKAVAACNLATSTMEQAVASMLNGWLTYADQHAKRYDSRIGDDGVLGEHWAAIGRGIRGLLNGECGRLDCGTVDATICNALDANECEKE